MEPTTIAFQGIRGAYSDLAARAVFPGHPTLPCAAFEDVFDAVRDGKADYGILPVENSIAGRVADLHHLLPQSGLFITAEHFQPIHHCLLGLPGSTVRSIKTALSHPQALAQCRMKLREMNIAPEPFGNTAAAAAEIVARGDISVAAISSSLAAQLHGLTILAPDLHDEDHNTTRFLVLARQPIEPAAGVPALTTLVFRVRHVPAALYKALGGFATNGVNITKLESYMLGGSFHVTQFYCDVEGRPGEPALDRALEELAFFAPEIRILGTYPMHDYRLNAA
jgi:prephenate dehydratase